MPHNDTYGFYDKETGYVNTYITPKQVFEKPSSMNIRERPLSSCSTRLPSSKVS